jgi:glycosyltransferase involved in cell wall biosynthesis
VSGLRVSVVIPAYKAARTIGPALDSVLAQTTPPYEIVVVDDGSPDDTAAAVAPYLGRVRYVRKDNGGAASARNRGLDETTGEVIALLDADDLWEPTKLERQLAVLTAHPEVGLVAGRFFVREPDAVQRDLITTIGRHDCERVLRPKGNDVLRVARRVWTGMLLFRRSVLGTNRFDTTLKTAQDVDMWIRLVATAPSYLLWDPLATYVLTPHSLSRSDVAADSRNMLRVLHRYSTLLGWWGRRGWEAEVYRMWAGGHLGDGEPRRAVAPAWGRFLRQPWSPQAWWIVAKSLALAARKPRSTAPISPSASIKTARVS